MLCFVFLYFYEQIHQIGNHRRPSFLLFSFLWAIWVDIYKLGWNWLSPNQRVSASAPTFPPLPQSLIVPIVSLDKWFSGNGNVFYSYSWVSELINSCQPLLGTVYSIPETQWASDAHLIRGKGSWQVRKQWWPNWGQTVGEKRGRKMKLSWCRGSVQ